MARCRKGWGRWSPFPVELGECTEFFLCHSGHELPGLYLCVNLHTIQEGTICWSVPDYAMWLVPSGVTKST